jgi:hypothetical protein
LPAELYQKIEYGIFENQKTEVPGLGIQCSLKLAPWAFAILVLGLLIQIQSQLAGIRTDVPHHGIGEPWLLLDGRRGLEWLFAWLWLIAIVASPLISSLALVTVMGSELHAAGIGVREGPLGLLSGCIAIVSLSILTSVTLMRGLWATRSLRAKV